MPGDATAYFANPVVVFTGGITSLNVDGFSLGTSTIINTSGNIYHWQAFGNAYSSEKYSGAADFATGVYYGNGINNRNITDMPFQPDFVAVKANSATAGAFRTSAAVGDLTSSFGATAEAAGQIKALSANGFQVGTSTISNASGVLYGWFAFKQSANFVVGSYAGSASAQQIATGFWPDSVWVKNTTAVGAVQHPSTLAGDNTQAFLNVANSAGMITGFTATGFSVGTNASANTSGATYRYAAWRVPPNGSLTVGFVDNAGTPIATPSFGFPNRPMISNCTESVGTFGSSSQRIRIANMSANDRWSLALEATDGPLATWSNSGNTQQFDFNDIFGTQSGCSDGSDGDDLAGKLRIEPSTMTLAAQNGCSTSGISLGSDANYNEGIADSLTLLTAGAGTNIECYWDMYNMTMRQTVPGLQAPDTYSLDLTLTVTSF